MSFSPRLKNLENQKEQIESRIAEVGKLINECYQDINAESNTANKSQLYTQIDNFSTEIDQLYDNIDEIEEKINKLKLDEEDLSSNDHLDNPKNQLELNIDKSLCYINFKKALETFETIQSQFNKNGDAALFFMEKSLTKRGDLCLQKLQHDFKSKLQYDFKSDFNSVYRNSFRYCSVNYTSSGDLETVIQGIANYFDIKNEQAIELVIAKIGESLQNDSVLFIEINCDINNDTEIDPLIPWFIENFWQPLRSKINEIRDNFEGIKVIAVIVSRLEINQRLLTKKLLPYYNKSNSLSRDKLVKIPLGNWTKDEIYDWLKIVDPGLTNHQRNSIASKIYNETEGQPNAVCYCVKKDLKNLIHSST